MTFPGKFKDHILTDQLDKLSVSFLVDTLVKRRGGVAVNIAYTYRLLGGDVTVIAAAGELDFEPYKEWLNEQGIDSTGIVVIPKLHCASFFANTDKTNAQIASFYPGAMASRQRYRLADLTKKPDFAVISPDETDIMSTYLDECQSLSIPYLFDPGQQLVRLSKDIVLRGLKQAAIVFVNEYEWNLLEREFDIDPLEYIQKETLLGVTLGEKGSRIYTDKQWVTTPAVPIKSVVDPTGAGDAYRGGFLASYMRGFDHRFSTQMGLVAASFCIEHKGTQEHSFTVEQFIKRFREHYGESEQLNQLKEQIS